MRAAIVLAAFAVSACQTPCPTPAGGATTVMFRCEDGSDLHVTFTLESAVVEQEGYTTLTLPDRIAGSGFRYEDNGAELRGRLNESRWTRPGAAETICQQTE
jgi:membrane-bound inhibitor of C-type lysozyme